MLEIIHLEKEGVGEWALFCENCFKDRVNPPSKEFFYNHYENDPYKDKSTIFVNKLSHIDNQGK